MMEGYKVSFVKILMFWYITRRLVFIRNIAHLIHCVKFVKKWMFLKDFAMESANWHEGTVSGVLCKNIFKLIYGVDVGNET